MMPLPPSRLNISWMLTNREEYLANGLWPTLVTVLVTRGPDTDFSRNTRSDLVPGPRHNCPHSQDRGKPRSLCIFFGPVSFYKALPDDSRGLADWNLRLNSFCPILHGSQPGCERPVSDFVWWSHVILPDVFDRKGLAAFKIQLPIDPVPPARPVELNCVKSNSAERICLQNWKELPRDHIWNRAGLPLTTGLSWAHALWWTQQTTIQAIKNSFYLFQMFSC